MPPAKHAAAVHAQPTTPNQHTHTRAARTRERESLTGCADAIMGQAQAQTTRGTLPTGQPDGRH
eukprot:5590899-Alexandrium_andersonii.AAC.1